MMKLIKPAQKNTVVYRENTMREYRSLIFVKLRTFLAQPLDVFLSIPGERSAGFNAGLASVVCLCKGWWKKRVQFEN